MVTCDVLSKDVGAVKVFSVNNFRLIYDTISISVVVQYSANFQNVRCNNKDVRSYFQVSHIFLVSADLQK
jgi:hypothetical protein